VHIGIIRRPKNVKRGRGRPTLTWTKAVKRDLKEWNIDKELNVDRKGWKCAIHVPEPRFVVSLFLLNRLTFSCAPLDLAGSCGFYLFMCFPVSSFFSSPLPLSPFSFLWELSSEVFIWGFISSLPQHAWDKKALLLLLLLL
jgi:hypothetical protein